MLKRNFIVERDKGMSKAADVQSVEFPRHPPIQVFRMLQSTGVRMNSRHQTPLVLLQKLRRSGSRRGFAEQRPTPMSKHGPEHAALEDCWGNSSFLLFTLWDQFNQEAHAAQFIVFIVVMQ